MSASLSWNTPAPLRLRIGAGCAVVLLHIAVLAAILLSRNHSVEITPPEQTVQVRFVEIAPQVQQAPAPPVPKPEPKPEPKPQPPKPVPKPKPKPLPKPEPKPVSETALSTPTPPVEPAPPAPAAPAAPPSPPEVPAKPAAPPVPVSNEPRRIGQIDYAGTPLVPDYPRVSVRMHEEGRVVIRVVIDTHGRVTSAVVERSSNYPRLDAAALATAREEHFKPYTENGVAYPASATVPYVFSLRN